VRPFKNKQVWQIDECYFCGGLNKNCFFCGGKNVIKVTQCPHAMIRRSIDAKVTIGYFADYYNSNQWPDKRGRFYQPVKLVQAFLLLSYYWNKYEGKK
jgi:hypothetical protein